jgi:lysophospholipase L1-like esterase
VTPQVAALGTPQVAAVTTPSKPLNIAVVGDSISISLILPVSPAGCVQAIGPAPDCQYDSTGKSAYPALLGQMLGANVSNYAVGGKQTDWMIANEVPRVSPNADIVVYEGGTNDLAANGPVVTTRVEDMVAAITARAPHAKIVFVGMRFYSSCDPAAVNAWNRHEVAVANIIGGKFVDMISPWPTGLTKAWPDGTHPAQSTEPQIASLVAASIAIKP